MSDFNDVGRVKNVFLILNGFPVRFKNALVSGEKKSSFYEAVKNDNPNSTFVLPVVSGSERIFQLTISFPRHTIADVGISFAISTMEQIRNVTVNLSYEQKEKSKLTVQNKDGRIFGSSMYLPDLFGILCVYFGDKKYFIGGIAGDIGNNHNPNNTLESYILTFHLLDIGQIRKNYSEIRSTKAKEKQDNYKVGQTPPAPANATYGVSGHVLGDDDYDDEFQLLEQRYYRRLIQPYGYQYNNHKHDTLLGNIVHFYQSKKDGSGFIQYLDNLMCFPPDPTGKYLFGYQEEFLIDFKKIGVFFGVSREITL